MSKCFSQFISPVETPTWLLASSDRALFFLTSSGSGSVITLATPRARDDTKKSYQATQFKLATSYTSLTSEATPSGSADSIVLSVQNVFSVNPQTNY
jgi:hypothetical protein